MTPSQYRAGGANEEIRFAVGDTSLGTILVASCKLLADVIGLHPKVVRQALRFAFLMPEVTSAVLEGRQTAGLSLAQIQKALPLSWTEQRPLLG